MRRKKAASILPSKRPKVVTQDLNALATEEIWIEPVTAPVNVSIDNKVSAVGAPLH